MKGEHIATDGLEPKNTQVRRNSGSHQFPEKMNVVSNHAKYILATLDVNMHVTFIANYHIGEADKYFHNS